MGVEGFGEVVRVGQREAQEGGEEGGRGVAGGGKQQEGVCQVEGEGRVQLVRVLRGYQEVRESVKQDFLSYIWQSCKQTMLIPSLLNQPLKESEELGITLS